VSIDNLVRKLVDQQWSIVAVVSTISIPELLLHDKAGIATFGL